MTGKASLASIKKLPGDSGSNYRGHLYVIELSTGVVKVGKTRNPQARIRTHMETAAKLGVSVTRIWASEAHARYSANETALIAALGPTVAGSEYFRVHFRDAVEAAKGLDYRDWTDEELVDLGQRLEAQSSGRPRMKTFSLREVAEQVLPKEWTDGVRWLQRRLRRGEISGYKVGHDWRMTEADVEALVARYRNSEAVPAAEPRPLSFTRTSRRAAS